LTAPRAGRRLASRRRHGVLEETACRSLGDARGPSPVAFLDAPAPLRWLRSACRVQLIGEPGTVDGVMMDFVIKNAGDNPDVHVQCFGDPNVHVINTQFSAVASDITFQP
jgi:hypothetical protein